ncbi:MAG: peptidylprolyl isomerase, partial [Betaproteobacteria bacterium]|nr:peptidylprolyl isomerase [Betaproteobacteria bacterium]
MKLSLAAASAALLFSSAVFAQNIAVVNGKPIPKARADAIVAEMVKGGQQKTPQLEQMVKDELIKREVMMQEADKLGITTSDDVKTQLELARQSVIIRALFADYQKRHPVTDADIKAEYDKFKAQTGDKEYHARHILLDSEAAAKDVIAKLKAGAKFEQLAKTLSKDPGSAANGGDLDWAPPSAYVKEFSDAMVKLGKGQTTQTPVKTQFGWHVIRLEDTRAAKIPSLEELKP